MKSKNLKLGITVQVKSWEEIQKKFTKPRWTGKVYCSRHVRETCGQEFVVKETEEFSNKNYCFADNSNVCYHPKWLRKIKKSKKTKQNKK